MQQAMPLEDRLSVNRVADDAGSRKNTEPNPAGLSVGRLCFPAVEQEPASKKRHTARHFHGPLH
jgi:hypothetical protein